MMPPKMKNKYKKDNSDLTKPLLSGHTETLLGQQGRIDNGRGMGRSIRGGQALLRPPCKTNTSEKEVVKVYKDNESFFNKIIRGVCDCREYTLDTGYGIMRLYDNRLEFIEFIRGSLEKTKSIQGNKLRHQEVTKVVRLLDGLFRAQIVDDRRDRITEPVRPGYIITTNYHPISNRNVSRYSLDLKKTIKKLYKKSHTLRIDILREMFTETAENPSPYEELKKLEKLIYEYRVVEYPRLNYSVSPLDHPTEKQRSDLRKLHSEVHSKLDEILIDALREKFDQAKTKTPENASPYEELNKLEKLIYEIFRNICPSVPLMSQYRRLSNRQRFDLVELYTEVRIKLHEIPINPLREEMLNISNNQRGYSKDRIFTELTRVAESIKKVAESIKKGEIMRIRRCHLLVPSATQSQLVELYNETVTLHNETVTLQNEILIDALREKIDQPQTEENPSPYENLKKVERFISGIFSTSKSRLCRLSDTQRLDLAELFTEVRTLVDEILIHDVKEMLNKDNTHTELTKVEELMDRDINRQRVDLPSPQWFLRLTLCLPTFLQTPALHFLLLERPSDTHSQLAELYDEVHSRIDQASPTRISSSRLNQESRKAIGKTKERRIEASRSYQNHLQANVSVNDETKERQEKEFMNSSLMKPITHEKNLTRDEEFDRSIKHRMITALRSVSNIEGLHDGNGEPIQYSPDFQIIPTRGDGYCAVYAIALALGAAHGDSEDQILVRYKGIVADLDALAPNQFKQLTEGFSYGESRTFNDLFLRWIARKYHIKINLYRSEGSVLQYMSDKLDESIDVGLTVMDEDVDFITNIQIVPITTTISILNTGASYGQHWSAIEPGQEDVLRDLCRNNSENPASNNTSHQLTGTLNGNTIFSVVPEELETSDEEKVEIEESKTTKGVQPVNVPPGADQNREIKEGQKVQPSLSST